MARITCKPNSVEDGYLSGPYVTVRFERCGREDGRSVSLDLAPDGVYIAFCVTAKPCELLPHLSTLTE